MDERKFALVIGNSEFPESAGALHSLTSAAGDVEAVSRVLSSPQHGGFSDVQPLLDLPHYVIMRKVNEVIRMAQRNDLILIYYSGHGSLDRHGNLYFATVDTEPDLLHATSVSAKSIQMLIGESHCRRIIVILDCCYSGVIGNAEVVTELQKQFSNNDMGVTDGYAYFYLLGANAVHEAYSRADENNGLLTKYMVQAMESGSADDNADGVITMPELYQYVKERVEQESDQTPKYVAGGATATLIISQTEKQVENVKLVQRIAKALHAATESEQIPMFVAKAATKILALPINEIRKNHGGVYGLLRGFANGEIKATELVNQWYLLENTGLPDTDLKIDTADADERWEVVTKCRRHTLDSIGPSYVLDKHYHFLDWNQSFDALIAEPAGLIRGTHAESFILKLNNRQAVIERSRKLFNFGKMPLVDIEPLEFMSPKYGLIKFQKIASQVPGNDGRTIAWSVNLNVTSAEKYEQLWDDMQEQLSTHIGWSKYAKSYDKMLLTFDAYQKLINDVTGMIEGEVVADLACGTGNGTLELLSRNPKRKIWAFDANEDMLEYMRQKLRKQGETLKTGQVRIIKGDLLMSLRDFPDDTLDGAVMINGLYAVKDRARCLREIYRVLKPGGYLAYSTSTDQTDIKHLFDAIRNNLKQKNLLEPLRPVVNNSLDRNLAMQEMICQDSKDDVIRYATSAGFKVNDDEVISGAYEGAVVIVRAMKPKETIVPTPSKPIIENKSTGICKKPGNFIRIFISYAHEDEQWCKRFQRYLKPAEKPGKLEIWTDKNIDYGDHWHNQIQQNLADTTHAILLVSTAFLNSSYIESSELPILLHKHQCEGLRIVPVLLEKCLFESKSYRFPDPTKGPQELFLKDLQAASVKEPLDEKSRSEQNVALHRIAEYILSDPLIL